MFDIVTFWIVRIYAGINDMAGTITSDVLKSPADVFGADYWDSLLKIGMSAVMPFAILILSFCMAGDMYKMYCRANGAPDLEVISLTFIKYIIPFVCMTYTYDLLQFIFTQINSMILQLYNQVTIGTGNQVDTSAFVQQVSQMSLWQKFGVLIQMFGPWLGTEIMSVVATVVVYGRLFEIVMFWIFAPIPFATFASDDLRSSVGMNFVKMFCALILQGGLIVLTVSMYLMLIKSVTVQTSVPGAFAMLGYTAILITVMVKTGSLSKRLLGTF
ncbi:hypothetical protein CAFE_15250 [Caprobacter fermentans]|uniref:Conjugal transfer protein TrbL n=1 Tax=Caproicibacter fermentans TaxID=2576756 RepID=A0A6N8HZB8_9FIRM|nr:hypothetical protein [Caproicibacter fermentans]MVB10827.1 hypothetical protein [Caproicibacter fermentans]